MYIQDHQPHHHHRHLHSHQRHDAIAAAGEGGGVGRGNEQEVVQSSGSTRASTRVSPGGPTCVSTVFLSNYVASNVVNAHMLSCRTRSV